MRLLRWWLIVFADTHGRNQWVAQTTWLTGRLVDWMRPAMCRKLDQMEPQTKDSWSNMLIYLSLENAESDSSIFILLTVLCDNPRVKEKAHNICVPSLS